MTNSFLKVPIVPYNTRHYCSIFLLRSERGIQRDKLNFEIKSTVVINVVILPSEIEC